MQENMFPASLRISAQKVNILSVLEVETGARLCYESQREGVEAREKSMLLKQDFRSSSANNVSGERKSHRILVKIYPASTVSCESKLQDSGKTSKDRLSAGQR